MIYNDCAWIIHESSMNHPLINWHQLTSTSIHSHPSASICQNPDLGPKDWHLNRLNPSRHRTYLLVLVRGCVSLSPSNRADIWRQGRRLKLNVSNGEIHLKYHRKTIGKWWFKWWFHGSLWGIPSSFIKHGWLENPRTQWRFLGRKITDSCGRFILQQTMFDYRRVSYNMYPLVMSK